MMMAGVGVNTGSTVLCQHLHCAFLGLQQHLVVVTATHATSHAVTWVQDPVDGSPAVLVKRYNITQQKELEIKLAEQQEALQR